MKLEFWGCVMGFPKPQQAQLDSCPRSIDRRQFLSVCTKLGAALVGATAMIPLSGCMSPVEALTPSQASLRVGVDCFNPAYEMLVDKDAHGAVPLENSKHYAAGFDVAVVTYLAHKLGCRACILDVDHADLAEYLKRGYIDVAVSAVYNDSNDTSLSFSDAYAPIELAVVTRVDSPYAQASQVEQLSGALMAARANTDYDAAIGAIPGAVHLMPYSKRTNACVKVRDKEIDATVVDRHGFENAAELFPDLTLVPLPVGSLDKGATQWVRMAVRRDDTALLDGINSGLASLSESDAQAMWKGAKEAVGGTMLDSE